MNLKKKVTKGDMLREDRILLTSVSVDLVAEKEPLPTSRVCLHFAGDLLSMARLAQIASELTSDPLILDKF